MAPVPPLNTAVRAVLVPLVTVVVAAVKDVMVGGGTTVTVTMADRPVLVPVTKAAPAVVPALNVVAVVPAVPVCPLVGLSGWAASATPVAGVVVKLHAAADA